MVVPVPDDKLNDALCANAGSTAASSGRRQKKEDLKKNDRWPMVSQAIVQVLELSLKISFRPTNDPSRGRTILRPIYLVE